MFITSLNAFAKNYEFKNGNWFDGKKFKKTTIYSINGVFSKKKPNTIDKTIDLQNQFAIPPFGEAHNHSVDSVFTLDGVVKKYLDSGIFYIKNPNSILRFTKQVRFKINTPDTIDAVFAHGGLTSTGGHPIPLYAQIIKAGLNQAGITDVKQLENDSYYIIDNPEDFTKKWKIIKREKPDFIKTYLLYSKEFETRKKSKNPFVFRGLDPKVFPNIVKKAQADGYRVSTHIETAHDFKIAVEAGVDEINHLPAYVASKWNKNLELFKINENDAKLAAKRNIYVVPTYSLIDIFEKDPQIIKATKEIQKANLKMLYKHSVKIAIGCDDYLRTSKKEILYLHSLRVFSNLELLKMWTETTPQTIFPKRKFAKLQNGYEASFITLGNNPLKDFKAVENIKYRFKQGTPIK